MTDHRASNSTFHEVRRLFVRELRSALREKGIVINSLLIPLLLYPVLLWSIFTAISFVRGQEERLVSRMALVDLPARHASLASRLDEDPGVQLVAPTADFSENRISTAEIPAGETFDRDSSTADAAGSAAGSAAENIDDGTGRPQDSSTDATGRQEGADDRARALRDGELDLVATFRPAEGKGLGDNLAVELEWSSARDRSTLARQRFETLLAEYREEWLASEMASRGVTEVDWQRFEIDTRNEASSRQVGAFVLGLVAPLLMIIMIAVGCFYPAIDTTAGERERSTWETSLSLGVRRSSLVLAKYLYVATFGTVAGLLNLLAMTISMGAILQPLIGDAADLRFSLPWSSVPLLVVAAMALALFVAAGMMLFAAFARTFKEGQSMIAPFYLLIFLPPLLVTSPDLELTLGWALVPIANIALVFRQAILGVWQWPLIGLVLLVELVTIAACLWLARFVLSFEEVVAGTGARSLGQFWKRRWSRGGSRAGSAGRGYLSGRVSGHEPGQKE